eukprot:s9129_g1.t1
MQSVKKRIHLQFDAAMSFIAVILLSSDTLAVDHKCLFLRGRAVLPSSWLRLRSEGGAGPNGPEQQAVEPVRDEVRTSSSAIFLREIDRRASGVKSIVQPNQPARACRQQFTD